MKPLRLVILGSYEPSNSNHAFDSWAAQLILLTMPVKINELVIQVKVHEGNKPVDTTKSMSSDVVLAITESQKVALARDIVHKVLEEKGER